MLRFEFCMTLPISTFVNMDSSDTYLIKEKNTAALNKNYYFG